MRNLSKKKTAVERKRVETDEEKIRRPIAFFFVPNRGSDQLTMFGLCERRDRMLSRVEEGDHLGSFGVGYVATRSRIYRIGGDIIDFKEGDEFPKDVFYCDFSYGGEEEDGGIVCGKWEKGPSMSGCKPNPLLQVVNGKIYALGGMSSVFSYWIDRLEDDEDEDYYSFSGRSRVSSHWMDRGEDRGEDDSSEDSSDSSDDKEGGEGEEDSSEEEEDDKEEEEEVYLGKKQYVGVRDPMFEVLDPLTDKWETLPQPPFRLLYRSNGAKIKWHTVIGNVIYMHVVGCWKDVVQLQTLYSFDTATKKWKAHGPNPSPANKNDELFREKMRQMMGVSSRALVVGNRFYWFSFTSVGGCCMSRDRIFAIDLNDSLNNTFSPVRGLAHVTNPVDYNNAEGFLTHLGENRFYLVIVFISGIILYARTCTFELMERGPAAQNQTCTLLATNIFYRDNVFDESMLPRGIEWCKVPTPS